MRIPSKEYVDQIRSEYPEGSRVRLVYMDDVQAPPIGTEGTVTGVDDMGSVKIRWDNGSGLNAVLDGGDVIEKISPKLDEETEDILNKNGWSVCGYCDGDVEIETSSPAGEDLVIFLPVKDFRKEVGAYSINFDPNEHVEDMILEKHEGVSGIPSVRTLLHDADAIAGMLENLADALNKEQKGDL